jgi:UDP-glucose 4-epimerase
MKILVTGSEGFIGKTLSEYLVKLGHDIIGIDIKKYISQDIRSFINPNKDYIDIVVHTAAQTNGIVANEQPILDADINILGTINLLKEFPNSKFIFLSSCAVYGDGNNLKETNPTNPITPYGVSKLAAENYIKLLSKDWVILRLANVTSEYYTGRKDVISLFRENDEITIYGDGKQTRDFIDIEKVCKVIEKSFDKQGIFNIGSGKSKTILELAKEYNKPINFQPPKIKEIKNMSLNINKAKKEGLL